MSDLREQLQRGLTGRYTIERELGRGGMATVFLARDEKHGRPVALKVLHADLTASLGPERFQQEIHFAARLQHPHILTVLDSGQVGDPGQEGPTHLWFTMPYVDGESLRSRLDRERQLSVEQALEIAREVGRALDYAHQHGVVHRDIKPENILLTQDGSTLVADFGVARALAQDQRLTQTGMAIGTPAYMSPEQATGEKTIDARSDVYSLASVLYEMLAGESPYTGPTAQVVILKRFTEPVPSVRKSRPNVSEAVDQAIQRALSPVAADRFATAGEFIRALQASTTSSLTSITTAPSGPTVATGATVVPPVTRTGRRFPTQTATLVLGFLLGLGVLFAWRRSHSSAGPDGGHGKVLAVLPFENLGDSSDAYLADGITNELRGKLSQLPDLQVIARGSSNLYRKSIKTPQEIARELGADYLLTATVQWQKAGGTSRVRVSPELVDVTPGHAPRTKWQQPFDAAITDVFQVQADIAGQVASALNVALGAGQKQSLTERPTQNLAAYDAYLKGEASQGLIVQDAPSLRSAITYYDQAVALDSGFAHAWAQLSRAHAAYYYVGTPTPANALGAKRAAERAAALAPDQPESQLALGDYRQFVGVDLSQALVAYEAGLKLAPDNADLLTAVGLCEQSLGRWDAAVNHLERARTLDPRSAVTARRLAHSLLRLRRYPEALAAAERGLQVAPTSFDLIEGKAMVYLARGDLTGARAAIRAAPTEVEPTALVANIANYWDLYWALDDDQQRLLLRLPPSAYDGDLGTWGGVLAQTYRLRGDLTKARIYADSARLGYVSTLNVTPNDPQRRAFLGLMLGYLGRKEEAIREGERAVALVPASADNYTGPYLMHLLAKTYVVAGSYDKAIDQLEALLKMPYFLSAGWLSIDPNFAALKGNPRFDRLIASSPSPR